MTTLDELEALHRAATEASRDPAMSHEAVSVCASRFKYALLDQAPALLEALRAAQEMRKHVGGAGCCGEAMEQFDAAMARLEESDAA